MNDALESNHIIALLDSLFLDFIRQGVGHTENGVWLRPGIPVWLHDP
jgi:hypothetical protein